MTEFYNIVTNAFSGYEDEEVCTFVTCYREPSF